MDYLHVLLCYAGDFSGIPKVIQACSICIQAWQFVHSLNIIDRESCKRNCFLIFFISFCKSFLLLFCFLFLFCFIVSTYVNQRLCPPLRM